MVFPWFSYGFPATPLLQLGAVSLSLSAVSPWWPWSRSKASFSASTHSHPEAGQLDHYNVPCLVIGVPTWWFIPLSKWVITPFISGLTLLIPFITGVITHLLSGMSHQVSTFYGTEMLITLLNYAKLYKNKWIVMVNTYQHQHRCTSRLKTELISLDKSNCDRYTTGRDEVA